MLACSSLHNFLGAEDLSYSFGVKCIRGRPWRSSSGLSQASLRTVAQYAWYAWYAISGPCAEGWLFSCGLTQKPLRMLQNLKMLIMSRMLCGGITYARHEAWDETCQEEPAVEIWCPRKCWMITFDDSHRPPTKGPWSMTISNDYRFCMTMSSEQTPPAISQSWRPRTFTLPSFWYAWFRISSTDRFRGVPVITFFLFLSASSPASTRLWGGTTWTFQVCWYQSDALTQVWWLIKARSKVLQLTALAWGWTGWSRVDFSEDKAILAPQEVAELRIDSWIQKLRSL